MYFLHGISFEYAHVAYTDGLGGCPISLRYSSAEYERTRRRAHPLVKSRAGRRGGSRVRGPDTTSSSPRASFAGAPAASRIPQRRRGRTSHVLSTCPDRAASLGWIATRRAPGSSWCVRAPQKTTDQRECQLFDDVSLREKKIIDHIDAPSKKIGKDRSRSKFFRSQYSSHLSGSSLPHHIRTLCLTSSCHHWGSSTSASSPGLLLALPAPRDEGRTAELWSRRFDDRHHCVIILI